MSVKIRKGDTVRVIAGKDKDKEGKVLSVDAKNHRVLVEGINMITKSVKPNAANQQVDVEKLFSSSGYTSKKDKEHHGFGLRNIRMAVEDYDGLVKAESDESSFALSIMIPRK